MTTIRLLVGIHDNNKVVGTYDRGKEMEINFLYNLSLAQPSRQK